ncbi:MAG TPA: Na+/H+ antiporter NhaA [Gemmatimonadaceae bacterium]
MTRTLPPTDAPLIERVLRPFQQFIATEAASGTVLLATTAVALALANSPLASGYHHLFEVPLALGIRPFMLVLSLREWVNDGLMAIFFFLVGLEMKRELLVGALSTRRAAALPVAAALGGMLAPAAIYLVLNRGGVGSRGWGVPMATDIAFALGVLALLGRRMPSGLRVFLAALAIADDLGSVLVIAFFYSAAPNWVAMGGAALLLALIALLNVTGATRWYLYALAGVALWALVLRSGVHATIAGVLLAFAVPLRTGVRMEHALRGVVAFGIMPIFALANAGVALSGGGVAARSPLAWGIVLGLVIGKPVGIMLASYAAVLSGAAELPVNTSWRHLHGVGWLGGIGFTMSLFIASLAFGQGPMLDVAKLGVITASVVAGITGYTLLSLTSPVMAVTNADAVMVSAREGGSPLDARG